MHKCIRENTNQKCTNALAFYKGRQMHKCIQSTTSSTGEGKCTNAFNLQHHLTWGPPLQNRVGPKQMHKCIQSSTSSNREGKCTNAFSLQYRLTLGPSLHNRAGPKITIYICLNPPSP